MGIGQAIGGTMQAAASAYSTAEEMSALDKQRKALAGGSIDANNGLGTANTAAYQSLLSGTNNANSQLASVLPQAFNNQQTYTNSGAAGSSLLSNLLSGNAAQETSALEATPGYQFTLNQGLNATQNSEAAKGLGTSGNAQQAAGNYASGLASQTYQNMVGDAQSATNTGLQNATSLDSLLASINQGEASNYMNLGQQNSSNLLQTAGAQAQNTMNAAAGTGVSYALGGNAMSAGASGVSSGLSNLGMGLLNLFGSGDSSSSSTDPFGGSGISAY